MCGGKGVGRKAHKREEREHQSQGIIGPLEDALILCLNFMLSFRIQSFDLVTD